MFSALNLKYLFFFFFAKLLNHLTLLDDTYNLLCKFIEPIQNKIKLYDHYVKNIW